MDEPMRQFVARYTGGQANSRLRLMSLHQAVRGAGGLGIQYDPFADGTASEAFHRGAANCLSFSNLFVALAREAGLDAGYQWVEVRPQWSRVSERVQVGLHVNVMVRLRDGTRYMVDIDPLPSRDMAGSRELSDTEAEALYYNNIAVDALGRNDLATAWYYLLQALQLTPANAHLWVNLGALYRAGGQHRDAEQSYLKALDLDFAEYSAMTNLAVLYGLEGREEDREYWLGRVEKHRQANPFYHAWQGDEAAAAGDWPAALAHYDRAVALLPGDGQLLFSRGLIQYRLGNLTAAARDMEQAIDLATLQSDITLYQQQLEEVRQGRPAGA
jgi:Flp pilus assembly protein TadD